MKKKKKKGTVKNTSYYERLPCLNEECEIDYRECGPDHGKNILDTQTAFQDRTQ